MLEETLEEREDHVRARVADVDAPVDGRPAGVNTRLLRPLRGSACVAPRSGCPGCETDAHGARLLTARRTAVRTVPCRCLGRRAAQRSRGSAGWRGRSRPSPSATSGPTRASAPATGSSSRTSGWAGASSWTRDGCEVLPAPSRDADIVIGTDSETWLELREGKLSGLDAFRSRRLWARGNLDLAIAFEGFFRLPNGRPPLLRVHEVEAGKARISTLTRRRAAFEHVDPDPRPRRQQVASTRRSRRSPPATRCTRSTCRGSAPPRSRRGRPIDAAWFARAVVRFMDAMGIRRAHLVGNSLGGGSRSRSGCPRPNASAASACSPRRSPGASAAASCRS